MQITDVLKNKNQPDQTPGDKLRSKQEIEECVTFVRLELYNRDMPCGAKAVRERLEKFYHVKPLPSERTIARILARHGLTYVRRASMPDRGAWVAPQRCIVLRADFYTLLNGR